MKLNPAERISALISFLAIAFFYMSLASSPSTNANAVRSQLQALQSDAIFMDALILPEEDDAFGMMIAEDSLFGSHFGNRSAADGYNGKYVGVKVAGRRETQTAGLADDCPARRTLAAAAARLGIGLWEQQSAEI